MITWNAKMILKLHVKLYILNLIIFAFEQNWENKLWKQ